MLNGRWETEKRPYSTGLFHLPLTIFHSGRHFSAAC
jgi:hypothetical protein